MYLHFKHRQHIFSTKIYYKLLYSFSRYTPSAISFLKLSTTAALSYLYVTLNQLSLIPSTFTVHFPSLSNPPISVGSRYSAFCGFAGTSFSKEPLNPSSKTARNAGSYPSFAEKPQKFMDT